jgi:DNA-binding CsgD family transcriptional regulator
MTERSAKAATGAPQAPRREQRLAARADELLDDARTQLGAALDVPSHALSLELAASALTRVTWTALSRLEQLDRRDRSARPLTELALRAVDLEDELRRYVAEHRAQLHAEVQHGLTRLRRIGTSAGLIDRVCEEVVTSCGFSRAMLTRVENDTWLPWMAYFRDDRRSEREFVEWMNKERFPLEAMGRELDRQRPVLVRDALAEPRTFKPIIAVAGTPSYVAAPVSPAGRTVGFLYADRLGSGRPVDEIDRDILWAFAEGFGRIYERIVLLERIRAQRNSVREAFDVAETIMTSLANAEIELVRREEDRLPSTDERALESPLAPAAIDDLLTSREKEVLAMMVRGGSNASIAERLVIREGTVKSHVKHILRKIGAVNRSEAISWYMGVTPDR